jgi:hypothetical protein
VSRRAASGRGERSSGRTVGRPITLPSRSGNPHATVTAVIPLTKLALAFGLLRREKAKAMQRAAVNTPPAFFKDAAAAFEYGCNCLECPLLEGGGLPALVLDARELFGVAEPIKLEPDGNQIAVLRVASNDGGFIVDAITAGPKGPTLDPGQLVWWLAIRHKPDIADLSKDRRFGWLGVILCTLKLEYRNGIWACKEKFLHSPG